MFSDTAPSQISQLAADILRLSDFFIQNPEEQTPWHENYCQNAYRNYFLPLNFIRAQNILARGLQVGFFKDFSATIDWGSGPGTASLAVADNKTLQAQIKKQILIEKSGKALSVFSDLNKKLIQPDATTELSLKNLRCDPTKTLLMFSYSLTEMKSLPPQWNQFEGIMILEPATSQDGRKLLELRSHLMVEGYTIWAPCTHQEDCPLLTESKTDWCHDRFHVVAPDWFHKLEEHLPMRNRTVTTSYLLARKLKPTFLREGMARLTGDSQEENGKTKQLVCRGPQREFLAWLHRNKSVQTLPRGELVHLPTDLQQKSNELRVTETPVECYESENGN